jgi:hypothetical protein
MRQGKTFIFCFLVFSPTFPFFRSGRKVDKRFFQMLEKLQQRGRLKSGPDTRGSAMVTQETAMKGCGQHVIVKQHIVAALKSSDIDIL